MVCNNASWLVILNLKNLWPYTDTEVANAEVGRARKRSKTIVLEIIPDSPTYFSLSITFTQMHKHDLAPNLAEHCYAC